MKMISGCLGVFFLLGLVGCNRSEPGGGAKKSTEFTINGPAMTTSIRQGEAHTISLKVDRGSEFKQAVKLHAEAPAGIEAALSETTVKTADKGDVTLNVTVAASAAPGEHVIKIKGTPENGAATTLDLKVKVAEHSKNMKLMLRGPSTLVTVKQGETVSVKIDLEPNPKYLPVVTLKAESPKGVRAELAPNMTIKAIEGSDADLRITADKNASLGEHTVRITGSADAATVTPMEVRVKVVAP